MLYYNATPVINHPSTQQVVNNYTWSNPQSVVNVINCTVVFIFYTLPGIYNNNHGKMRFKYYTNTLLIF